MKWRFYTEGVLLPIVGIIGVIGNFNFISEASLQSLYVDDFLRCILTLRSLYLRCLDPAGLLYPAYTHTLFDLK